MVSPACLKMAFPLAFFLLIACGEVSTGDGNNVNNAASDDTIMDFNIQLTNINSDIPFSAFSNKLLMIYYISPLCPYCQRGYGAIQEIANEYESKGLASVAIAVGSVSESDILWFIEEQEASMPFFHDSENAFGKKYGYGYVPVHYLVFPNGKTVSYQNGESEINKMIFDIEEFLLK
jgi:peroxiredoxin